MAVNLVRLPSGQFRVGGYKTTSTPFFLLKVKRNGTEQARIGVVVGTSVHGAAVKRNFWKRQARTALSSAAVAGHDILMIVSPGVVRLTRKQFREKVMKALATAQ